MKDLRSLASVAGLATIACGVKLTMLTCAKLVAGSYLRFG